MIMTILKRIGMVLMCLVLAGTGIAAAEEGTEKPKRIESPEGAETFVRILLGEDPASLDGEYLMSADMDSYLKANGGFAALAESLAALGAATEICPAYEDTAGGMKTYRIPCRFALMPLDIALTLDGNGAVAGLTTQLFTGGSQKTETAEKTFTETELALPVPEMNGELPGTLTMPEDDGPFPAVVLIHGSGPNDRDETIGMLKPFRDIAEDLAERGIAVYRFDKRTLVFGEEMAADTDVTLMEETVTDAAEAVQLLAAQEKIDRERIFVLGHSLGGTAIPAIDQELKNRTVQARGYILMAPGARRLDLMIREQYDFLAGLAPELGPERDAAAAELDRLNDPDSLKADDAVAGAYAAYWKWLIRYDVVGMASEITAPCLLLQGEEDYQATMEDFNLFRSALGDKENWTFRSYPGLVHCFIHGLKTDGPAAYQSNERVDQNVTADIADFILSR